MGQTPATVEMQIHLPVEQADYLRHLAAAQQISEEEIIEKALGILFHLTDLLGTPDERRGWSALSESSLARVWDNAEDARYDNWQELYGVSSR